MGRQDGRIVGGVDHRGRAAAGASSLLVGGVVGGVDHRGRAAAGASLLLVGGVGGGVDHRGHAGVILHPCQHGGAKMKTGCK